MTGRKKNECADTEALGQDWKHQVILLSNLVTHSFNPSPQEVDLEEGGLYEF